MTWKWRIPNLENPEFFLTSYLGQGSFLVRRRSPNLKKKIRAYSCITEICDGTGVRDPEVGKIPKIFFELFRPRVNFGAKQKSELKNFVLEGHPSVVCMEVFTTLDQHGIDGWWLDLNMDTLKPSGSMSSKLINSLIDLLDAKLDGQLLYISGSFKVHGIHLQ